MSEPRGGAGEKGTADGAQRDVARRNAVEAAEMYPLMDDEAVARRAACGTAARLSMGPYVSRFMEADKQHKQTGSGAEIAQEALRAVRNMHSLRKAFIRDGVTVAAGTVHKLAAQAGTVVHAEVDGESTFVVESQGRFWSVGPRIREALYGEVVLSKRVTAVEGLAASGVRRFAATTEVCVIKRMYLEDVIRQGGNELAPMQEDPLMEICTMLALARPGHSAISPMSACVIDTTNIYLVLPHRGRELFVQLTDPTINPSRRFAEELARRVFVDVVSAIAYAHARGIAHRDISLENIVFDPQTGRATVIDLGLATPFDPPIRPGDRSPGPVFPAGAFRMTGKHLYLAPEIVQRHPMTPAGIDLWAAASVLYLLVTGRPVMNMTNRSDDDYVFVRQHGVGAKLRREGFIDLLSPGCVDLLDKMLVPKPPSARLCMDDVLAHPWVREELQRREQANAAVAAVLSAERSDPGAPDHAASSTSGK